MSVVSHNPLDIMKIASAARCVFGAIAALSLAACGGGTSATVGGTLSGLAAGASVVLQNNAADSLTLTANGGFTFATAVANLGAYSVTVLTQPAGQTCTVGNATGSIDSLGDDVTNVSVTCAVTASLGGTVSGLAAGTSVTLSNAGVLLPIASNGAFAFAGTLPAGTTYNVTVATQPAGQTCTVTNPTGSIVANTLASVTVTCR